MDMSLLLYYAFWFLGNYYFNLYNKFASMEAGGFAGGMLVTISVAQLAVCSLYGLVMWIVGYNPATLLGLKAPTKHPLPKIKMSDIGSMMSLSIAFAATHTLGVIALTSGPPAFGQIVKAAEPVFAAVVNTFIYGKSISLSKWLVLPLIVGGVAISTLKPNAAGSYSVDYDMTALVAGGVCNVAAAFKGSENARALAMPGLKERLGGVGNTFALTIMIGFAVSLPVMVLLEGAKWGEFVALLTKSAEFRYNIVASGISFYLYNELATMTLSQTGAVTASVANTAKRAIVLVGMAIALGKPLRFEEQVGASVAICAVLLYSLLKDKPKEKDAKKVIKEKPALETPSTKEVIKAD